MTTAITVQLDIAPLSGTIGAEIRGLDLHGDLDPETVAAIRQALLDFKVIFFPGAHLNPEEHKDFASRFGEITVAHPVVPGIDDHREVFEIDYTKVRVTRRRRIQRVRPRRELAHRRDLRRDSAPRLDPQRGGHPQGGRRHPVG